MLRKIRKQVTKDYVVHPVLSGPSFLHTIGANAAANLVRNLWTHSVIMCGHFPEGVETFERRSIEGETRGEWYLRQMLGSANITGSPLMHLMTGNLSFQVEHHLFPDLPSNRYQEIAPKVQELFERYGLTYTTGSLPRQVGSAWKKVFRLSLPNDFGKKATAKVASIAPGGLLGGTATEDGAAAGPSDISEKVPLLSCANGGCAVMICDHAHPPFP